MYPPLRQNPGYVGCFNNTAGLKMTVYNGYAMDVVRWYAPPYSMTTERCTDFCAQKGFSHAALQANYLCFCLYQEQVRAEFWWDCRMGSCALSRLCVGMAWES